MVALCDAVRLLLCGGTKENFEKIETHLSESSDFRHILEWCSDYEDCTQAIEEQEFDVYLVGLEKSCCDNSGGLKFLKDLRRKGDQTPVILLTCHEDQRKSNEECEKLRISRCICLGLQEPQILKSVILDTILHFRYLKCA